MNYIDYLKWRSDLSFKVDEFNVVDNIVFSQLVYLNFDALFQKNNSYTISDLAKLYLDTYKDNELPSYLDFGLELMELLSIAKRYENCIVHDYVSYLNDSIQFTALIIDISSKVSVICFKGTDDSLIGWKEDAMMSYQQIPSQIEAVKYLNSNIKLFKKYIILGHSKGGALALYGAVNCNRYKKKQILRIYSNDGPGLNDEFYDLQDYEIIKDRFYKIMPVDSIVGTIYDNDDCHKIYVASSNMLLLEHNPNSWFVLGNKLVEKDNPSFFSISIKKGFEDLFNNTTNKQRQIFVESFFDCLKKENINSLYDLKTGDLKVVIKTFKNLISMDKKAYEVVEQFMKTFTEVFSNQFSSQIKNKLKK